MGKPWNKETLRSALAVLKQEVHECTIPMEEEGISTDYRRQQAENFFYKSFLHVALAVNPKQVAPENMSAAKHLERPLSRGTQDYTEYPELFPLTQPIIKRAAFVQATGEVKYTQDVQLPVGGFHASMVKSSRPHARFSFTKKAAGLDALKALLGQQYPDFQAFMTMLESPAAFNTVLLLEFLAALDYQR